MPTRMDSAMLTLPAKTAVRLIAGSHIQLFVLQIDICLGVLYHNLCDVTQQGMQQATHEFVPSGK